jgi:hypothetical protein
MRFRLSIVAVCAVLAAACGGALRGGTLNVDPPCTMDAYQAGTCAGETVRTVAVVVRSGGHPVAGATCTIDQAPDPRGASGVDGYIAWDHLDTGRRDLQLTCTADGYVPWGEHRALTTSGNEDLAPVDLVRLNADAGEHGPVHVDGLLFRRGDGSIFPWRGCTDFLLFKRFREEGGPAITPIVNERVGAGCNVFRVLGMVNSFATLRVDDHYYDDLSAFADFIAGFGARLEFVVFADAQIVMPDASAERVHADMVARTIGAKWNVFLEAVNEPFKNIPGGAATADSIAAILRGHGAMVASGNYDVPTCATSFPHADYVTVHSERKDEWPRTARALGEIRDGFEWGPTCGPGFSGVHVPVVGDEPIGFSETEQPGKRSASADDAAYYAGTSALMGAGATFHSDDGVVSQAWRPVQQAAAQAFFDALRWVPVDAQLAPYLRGGTDPGCRWIGESVAEHDDRLELRSFAKVLGANAWLVQIRTTRPTVVPCHGWQVVAAPRRGFAQLARQ